MGTRREQLRGTIQVAAEEERGRCRQRGRGCSPREEEDKAGRPELQPLPGALVLQAPPSQASTDQRPEGAAKEVDTGDPAIAAGVSDRMWTIRELMAIPYSTYVTEGHNPEFFNCL